MEILICRGDEGTGNREQGTGIVAAARISKSYELIAAKRTFLRDVYAVVTGSPGIPCFIFFAGAYPLSWL